MWNTESIFYIKILTSLINAFTCSLHIIRSVILSLENLHINTRTRWEIGVFSSVLSHCHNVFFYFEIKIQFNLL